MRNVAPIVNITINDSVAFFGCWGAGCQPNSGQWLLAKDIDANPKIEAMITAGDNFYEKYLPKEETKESFFHRNVDMCYAKDMYAALGNHDIELYNFERNHTMKNSKWILPAKNYIIHINDDIRVVMINTNPIFEEKAYRKYVENGERLLEDDMKELNDFIDNLPPSDRLTIVVGHHPFLTNRHKLKEGKRTIDKRVRNIIAKADLYICADEHNLQHIVSDVDGLVSLADAQRQLDEFILGGGGGDPDTTIIMDYPEETKFSYPYHGYGVFDVNSKTMSIRCLDEKSKKMKDSGYPPYVVKKRH